MLNKEITVLIIDDDEVDKQAVKRALKSSGFKVQLLLACDLESGISAAGSNHLDCIFLDYSLPGCTGFDFLDRYHEINGQAPVIMITSLGNEQLAVEAMRKGACDYIPKSLITPEGIAQSLRYALKLHETLRHSTLIEKELHATEKRLDTVISNSPLILFSLDKQGIITMFKGNGTKSLEQNAGQIIGKSLFDTGSDLPVQLNDYLAASLGKETRFTSKTTDRHYEVHFIPMRDEHGNMIEMMGVATDITGMKKTEEELIKTITISEESSKIKELFLANMSHEIRTPVHGIMSLTDILYNTTLTEEQRTYLTAVKRSADNLMVIINDILDLSKIESGKMTFENTPFNFKEVIQMSIELFRHKAAEKNLELIADIENNIPSTLKGDPVRLSQIINNLVSNAIKFTENGYVKVEIRTLDRNDSSCVIHFNVSDTGIGIPPQKLSSIFDSFTQAGDDITRKYGGTGLGLSIVKKLTELQGGYLHVESELNKGTSFHVNLPMNYADEHELSLSASGPSKVVSILPSSLKILVVEDNEINQMIINKLLRDWGVGIENASNGLEAFELIRDNDFHIVLMDIEMPEMNGYDATSRIRKQLPAPQNAIPILAMTAHASMKEKEKCFACGMNDYISKPFDPADVRNKILQLTSATETSAEQIKNNPENQQAVIENKNTPAGSVSRVTNLDFLKEMSDDNDSFIRDFIALFLQSAPESITALQTNLKNKDWEQLRQVAHKIKPSLNYLGLKDLHAAAATIEDYAKQGINLDDIPELVQKIVTTCTIAFGELKEDLKIISA